MNAEGVIRILDEHREELRLLGVRRLGLFGSTARNEATETSDLDFLVEFQQKSFDAYMDLTSLLDSLFELRLWRPRNARVSPSLGFEIESPAAPSGTMPRD